MLDNPIVFDGDDLQHPVENLRLLEKVLCLGLLQVGYFEMGDNEDYSADILGLFGGGLIGLHESVDLFELSVVYFHDILQVVEFVGEFHVEADGPRDGGFGVADEQYLLDFVVQLEGFSLVE